MRYSNTVACVTSAHAVEQKYIFKKQLAGANEMQGVIRKFTLVISQKEPSQMKLNWLLKAQSQKELVSDQSDTQTRKVIGVWTGLVKQRRVD